MKKLFTFLFVFILVFSFTVSFAEYPLSTNEQNYVGAWSMYAKGGSGKIYTFIITFLDSMEVVQSSLTFENGTLASNNKASGIWTGFTPDTILFSLAGTSMIGKIKDNGYLYLYFYDGMSLCGIYSRCENMTSVLGW